MPRLSTRVDKPVAGCGLDHRRISACFNALFATSDLTRMEGGSAEPHFLPGWLGGGAIIRYREDYAASALHEAAHWCLAGPRRRACPDYDYWYLPPPRPASAQQRFFAVEARVQALEWLFADAAGIPFSPSADNLATDLTDFRTQLCDTRKLLAVALPARARRFLVALGRWRQREQGWPGQPTSTAAYG
jgi:elongation factor P hydroxylase